MAISFVDGLVYRHTTTFTTQQAARLVHDIMGVGFSLILGCNPICLHHFVRVVFVLVVLIGVLFSSTDGFVGENLRASTNDVCGRGERQQFRLWGVGASNPLCRTLFQE